MQLEILKRLHANEKSTGMQANFKPEPLVTEADKKKNRRSLRRLTQGYLYLMLREDQGEQGLAWRLPRIPVAESDTSIRSAALRCLNKNMGDTMESFLVGNAPAGHWCSKNEMTFFMLGVILDGRPKLQRTSRAKDFAWMTRAEVLKAYQGDVQAEKRLKVLLVA
jgi:hypothetical protein